MTTKERIYTALRGRMPDQVPWTIYRGLLPENETSRRLRSLGLGLVFTHGCYTANMPNVKIEDVQEGEYQVRTYHTPLGTLSQKARLEQGYGSSWTKEHLIKNLSDYEILKFIIEDTVYEPNYQPFIETARDVGEHGMVMTSVQRLPFQKLWIEFAGIERLSIDLHENRSAVESVFETMMEKDRELWNIVADSPAEFVWCPDNITGVVTGPELFDRYHAPYYEEVSEIMHSKGKRIVVHMDGMMKSLVEYVSKLNIDIIEAFTPPPDGDLPLDEARKAWKDKVIWINFPSSVHIAKPQQIQSITKKLLNQAIPGDRFLIGVTENIPSTAWEGSLSVITETINRYGTTPLSHF